MSEMFWIALMEFATKFGLDAAIVITTAVKDSKNIDDAIAALKTASEKTAESYLAEAKVS